MDLHRLRISLTVLAALSMLQTFSVDAPNAFAKRVRDKSTTSTVRLTDKDLATADGSCRAGLHNGKIYCILIGLGPSVQLSPDSWADDDEPKRWNLWLVDFDNSLFNNFANLEQTDGQQTVVAHLTAPVGTTPGGITVDESRYFGPNPDGQTPFSAAIRQALQKTLRESPPMPRTQNPLKEVRLDLTFMRDPSLLPHYGADQLGFFATLTPDARNVIVNGRSKEGRSPGIQIISDSEGGTISVTDEATFLQKVRSLP